MKNILSKKLIAPLILVLTLGLLVGCDFLQPPTNNPPGEETGITLSGTVVDADSAPVSGLDVTIIGTDKTVTTGNDGKFSFTDLEAGEAILALIDDEEGTGKVNVDIQEDMQPLTVAYPVITEVVFLHFNDTHGKINNFPKIAWQIQELENQYENVFVLSAGDMFSGNPIVDQFDPPGEPMIRLMNEIGVDAQVLGNHDFDYGQQELEDRMNDADFPMICANMDVTTGVLSQPDPYTTLTTENDMTIKVLGLIQTSSSSGLPATHPNNVEGIEFTYGLDVATDYEGLADNDDFYLALTHLGYNTDLQLANQMGELDLIIGGHSHSTIDPISFENNVAIAQANDDLNYLGKIIVTFTNDQVTTIDGELLDVETDITGTDDAIAEMVENYNNNPEMMRVIAEATTPISGKEQLGYLETDAFCDVLDLDIAFQNSGGVRIDSLEGDITVGDIYALAPFNNEIIKYEMSYTELESLLTYGMRYDNFDLIPSGIHYTAVYAAGQLDDFIITDESGTPLDESQTYTVGLNSFVADSYEFDHSDPGENTYRIVADVVIEYIENGGNLDYTDVSRMAKDFNEDEQIATTEATLTAGNNQYDDSCSSGNLMADAIRDFTGADIAAFPSNSLQTGTTIEPGPVLLSALTSLYSSYIKENNVVTVEIKGSDLQDLFFSQIERYNNADLQVSGMTYTIHLDASNQLTSLDLVIAGTPLDPDATYTVSFNSYQYNSYYNISDIVLSETTSTETEYDILIPYVTDLGVIPASVEEQRVFYETEAAPAIAVTDATLTAGSEKYDDSCSSGNLIADAMVDFTGVDIALFPSGSLMTDVTIEPGDVYQSDLASLYSSYTAQNNVVYGDISGADLKALILDRVSGFDNVDVQVSGMTYDILTDGSGTVTAVDCYLESGAAIEDADTYSVAFDSYQYTKYSIEDKVTNVQTTSETELDILVGYVTNYSGNLPVSLEDPRVEFISTEEPIAQTDVEITAGDSKYDDSCTSGNLITDAIRDFTGADIATFPSNSLETGVSITPGPVYADAVKALYSSYISSNNVVIAEISGADFKAFVVARSQIYNNVDLQVSGMTYDMVMNADDEVVGVNCYLADGSPLDDATTYTVTFNSYQYGSNYGLADLVTNETTTTETESEMLLSYLEGLTSNIPTSLADPRVNMIIE